MLWEYDLARAQSDPVTTACAVEHLTGASIHEYGRAGTDVDACL